LGRAPFDLEMTPFGLLYPSDLVEMGMNDFSENKSILSQKRDYYVYNELTSMSFYLNHSKILTDWSFGGGSVARQSQNASGIYFDLVNGGHNLSLYLNEVYFKNHEKINNALSRFLPRFESIKTRVSNGVVQVYFLEKGVSEPIPISRLSDGTLRFLAIISLLCDVNSLGVLCIEEPELGLHPDAAALLAELLVEASQRMQIIVTTHSEAFLSALTRHDVNVLVTENFGQGTEVTEVNQEQLASWLDEYTLGDLWRIGKIGGNP
jgi:predicted ATPase